MSYLLGGGYGGNYPGPPPWAQANRQQMAMMYGHAMNNAYRPYVPPEDKIDNTGREG
jgi:hypothetical protein